MTAIKVNRKNIEVLTESEFKTLMDSRKSGIKSTRIPTSHELRAETIRRIEEDAKARTLQTRRFRNIATSGILTIGIGLGLSYYLNNSSPVDAIRSTPTTNIATGTQVFTINQSTRGIASNVSNLRYSTGFNSSSNPMIHNPVWIPTKGKTGTVTQGGDIAVVDTTNSNTPTQLSVTLLNANTLAKSYSTYNFPIDIYSCKPSTSKCGTIANPWLPFQNATTGSQKFISATQSAFNIWIQPGMIYDITMDAGQGNNKIANTASLTSATLSPSFRIVG